MEKNNLIALVAGVCASVILSVVALTNSVKSGDVITEEKINEIVKDYIAQNPKEIISSLEGYREKVMMEVTEKFKKAMIDNKEMLENYDGDPRIGSHGDKAKIKVVEFFDYGCVFCKKMTPILGDLISSDSDVQIVLKAVPFFGESSKYAAKMAIAVNKIDASKYYAFHLALMQSKNPDLISAADESLAQIGLDKESVKSVMGSQLVEEIIQKNTQLARDIGVRAAPAFVIGDELTVGALDQQALQDKISGMRKILGLAEKTQETTESKADLQTPVESHAGNTKEASSEVAVTKEKDTADSNNKAANEDAAK